MHRQVVEQRQAVAHRLQGHRGAAGNVDFSDQYDIGRQNPAEDRRSGIDYPGLPQLLQGNPPGRRAHGPPHSYFGAPHPQPEPAEGSRGYEYIDHQEHPQGLPLEVVQENVFLHKLRHRGHGGHPPVAVGHLPLPGPAGLFCEAVRIHSRTEAEYKAGRGVRGLKHIGIGIQYHRAGLLGKAVLDRLHHPGYHPAVLAYGIGRGRGI